MPPATAVAEALRRCGTDVAFGVPGGGPNLDVVGAMAEAGIRFVLTHGETSACIMASVHGRLTGRPAPAVVTRGPGAASAVNGAAQATLDRHPLVLITDTVPGASAARVAHQRLDQGAMLAPAVKAGAILGSDCGPDRLAPFFALATEAPAGAVHLDYDTTVQSTVPSIVPSMAPSIVQSPVGAHPSAEEGAEDRIRAMIEGAEHPVVIVGLGVVTPAPPGRDPADLRRSLEVFGAPVLTSYQAVGAIPTEHPLSAGLFTNGATERPILQAADLIVAVGLDMVEPIPAPWEYRAPVVSLTPSPTVDPYLPMAAELTGHPADLVAKLLEPGLDGAPGHRWAPDAGARHRRETRARLRDGAVPGPASATVETGTGVGPLEAVELLAEAAPASVTTTVDAGAHFLAIMPFWPVTEPNRLLISNGLATMGFALPAAVAAALAEPGRPVLCLVGDGGLGMTLAELETVARLDLPITVVVFNDSALSLIRIKQRAHHGGPEVVGYRETDFAAVAVGLGVDAVAVRDRSGLRAALARSWDRPRLIDVTIDPSPYRHLIDVTRG